MLMIGECREWYTDIIVLVFKCSVRLTFLKYRVREKTYFCYLAAITPKSHYSQFLSMELIRLSLVTKPGFREQHKCDGLGVGEDSEKGLEE